MKVNEISHILNKAVSKNPHPAIAPGKLLGFAHLQASIYFIKFILREQKEYTHTLHELALYHRPLLFFLAEYGLFLISVNQELK